MILCCLLVPVSQQVVGGHPGLRSSNTEEDEARLLSSFPQLELSEQFAICVRAGQFGRILSS